MCSIQRALLDEMPENLYAVTAGFTPAGGILIRGYYYSDPTDEDKESLSCVGAEVIADFHNVLDAPDRERIGEQHVNASNLIVLEMIDFWALIKSRRPNPHIRFTPVPTAPEFPTTA